MIKQGLNIRFFAVCLALAGMVLSVESEPPAADKLHVLTVTGIINPVVGEYVREELENAQKGGAAAALIYLDTPGGLLDATRDVVQAILNAPFPVIVYVAPRGARAASAGVFITLAADIAAMAPETHLGAAHPVSIGSPFSPGQPGQQEKNDGGSKSVMDEKAVSDAAAYARSLAASKGRNADWAEKAVRESRSLTAEEALKNDVIDLIAADETELLSQAAKRKVTKNDKVYHPAYDKLTRADRGMNALRRILHTLANPNLAYLLLMLGFYALIYEFASPGIGLGAIVGIISLVLAFFALQILPLNYAALALLTAGVVMMFLDMVVGAGGLLLIGGLIAFAIGSFLLIDSPAPYLRVSLQLIAGAVLATGGFFVFAVKKIWGTRKLPPSTGKEGLLGSTAEVRDGGLVFLHGEYWGVDSDEKLSPGDKVRVEEVVGIRLRVKKISEPNA